MQKEPRLYKKRGIYYAAFPGNVRRSLRTKYKAEARENLELEKERYRIECESKSRLTEPMKLSGFLGDYLKHRIGISLQTIRKDKLTFKLLIEAVGDILLTDLSTKKIEEFERACMLTKVVNNREYKATPRTVNGYLRHLKAALHYAVDCGYIPAVPKITMLKEGKIDMMTRIIMPDKLKEILDKANEARPEFGRYLTVMIWTACRRGEGAPLKWEHIDFKKNTMSVIGKGNRERTIPMLPQVKAVLKPIKKDNGLVFPTHHLDTLSKWFHAIAASCGVTAKLHNLRHSAITFMIKSGVPAPVVQAIAGHENIATTMIYTHILPDHMAQEMDKFRYE